MAENKAPALRDKPYAIAIAVKAYAHKALAFLHAGFEKREMRLHCRIRRMMGKAAIRLTKNKLRGEA